MKIRIDSHTHSVASGHAYSTIEDLARGAKRRGLKGFVITDHGPQLPGGAPLYHFGNLKVLPERIRGVRLYRGVEANILDQTGAVDLPYYYFPRFDFVMAGFHEVCFPKKSVDETTEAMVAALRSPFVDAVSHPGNPAFAVNYEAVVRAAAEYGKAIEINDSSFRVRSGSAPNCQRIASLCVQFGARIVTGSDAHYWSDVGRFDEVQRTLKEAKVPDELVLNASVDAFDAFVAARREERTRVAATMDA